MTPWIIDASLAMTWYLVDEESRTYGLWILDSISDRDILVPALFVYEFSNALVSAHRRKRISREVVHEILDRLSQMNIEIDPVSMDTSAKLAALSLRHGLTCYDAAYLELGIRTGFPVATLDKALLNAMNSVGVDLVTA